MKIETLVFDKLKKMIPADASKTILFANVADTSYELFFYCMLADGEFHQCYTLAENGVLDSHLLDLCFSEIASQIKSDKTYWACSIYVFNFLADPDGVYLDVEYYEKNAKMYKVKKDWKEKYLI